MPGLPATLLRAWLSSSHAELGEFGAGTALGEEGLRIAEAANHPFSIVGAAYHLGHAYLLQGNLPAASDHLRRAMAYGRERQIISWTLPATAMLGYVRVLSGDVGDGTALLEQSIAEDRQHHAPLRIHWLADAYIAGRLVGAADWATQALAKGRESGARGLEAWALRGLGDLAAYGSAPAAGEAERYYRESLVLATQLGMRPLAAHCHLGLGTLYGKLGRQDAARAELDAAAEMYRAMDMPFWLARAEQAIGH